MRFSLMLGLHTLQYPFLFSVPLVSQVIGLRGLFIRPPRNWDPATPIMAQFLSLDPPIFCCQPQPWPFGAAHYLAARFPDEPLVFLQPITMSLERRAFALALAAQHRRFRRAHPRARLILMANTQAEELLLRKLGVDVHLIPQNMFIDETMYHPIPGQERRCDAIYNAQLAPFKRHELARLVPSCAYVTKMFKSWSPHLKRAQLDRFVRALPHGHTILNDIGADDVVAMDHLRVNAAMASAHVGLCLSRLEGAMYASSEYLLAGLPVVSTRSQGGRDTFFHPDTTLIVADDPRAVQDGVAAMKARAIPPDYVRATTLRLMTIERERFNTFIDGLRETAARHTNRDARRDQVERTDPRWSFDYFHKLSRFGHLSDFEAQLSASLNRSPTAAMKAGAASNA
ncbi:glycosyltransferase [Methylobacterium sp. BTF04]|uniref:glycosyltransferase n=1 Tax=Methylobacterium sp. BTF04 TaxID=2708300 RepID=UPI0013D60426|nr:glycosyltransferase [Methylobacterium sp. BTF04]NEU11918.1 glycosyltransferase [Methylobacterium sp. BTF04]